MEERKKNLSYVRGINPSGLMLPFEGSKKGRQKGGVGTDHAINQSK